MAIARNHGNERLAYVGVVAKWWAGFRVDLAACLLLLLAVALLTWPLWRTLSGVVNYIDYNLPVSADASSLALRHSFSPWSGAYGLGGPNVGFLGTMEFLALFRLTSIPFGLEVGSRLLLIVLLWADALGAYLVLRSCYRIGAGPACAGALFYVLNPWTYDAVSQGHLYTLEVLAVVPFLVLAVPKLREISTVAISGIAVAVAVAFGSDYHFGVALLGFLGTEMLVLVVRGKGRRAARLATAVGAGLGLLGVFLYPYVSALSTIRSTNNPAFSDLSYFSRFTSWTAAFSLLRRGLNAWAEVGTHGAVFRTAWSFICIGVSFMAVVLVVRGGWRRLTGSPALPVFALASIALANGANGLTKDAAVWVYSHVPLAGIFRDPSKFLLFPLLLYVPTVALLFEGEVPGMIRGDSAEASLAKPNDANLSTDRIDRGRGAWTVAAPLLVLVLFAPLLYGGIGTISTIQEDSDNIVSAPYARVSYLPPWQFLRYPGQSVPVTDPVQLYPRAAVAGLGPDYDGSSGNSFLRWLYSALYFRRTDSFYDLAQLAAISDVVARSNLEPVAGYSVVQRMLAQEHLLSALRTQRQTYDDKRQLGDQVVFHTANASTISSSNALLRIAGSNLGVLNDLADLTNIARPAICFEPECPSGDDGLSVGLLNDVPPGPVPGDQVQIESTGDYDHEAGGSWISGRVAYAEGFGAITEQLGEVAVGIRQARGRLAFAEDLPAVKPNLWLQVLRGPDPTTYTVDCGSQRLSATPPPALGFVWAWVRIGPIESVQPMNNCSIGLDGSFGAVAGGVVTSGGFSPGARNIPSILLSSGAGADFWRRAQASSFNYPGVTSTAAIVSARGELSFELQPAHSSRHLYARVVGIRGRAQLRSRQATPVWKTRVITRDQRVWIDLGELSPGERRADISVRGGKAALIRIAVANPRDILALRRAGSSEVPVRLSGNAGLDETSDAVAISSQPATYLIVRSAADGFWSLDGRQPDGKYAGYGQLYRISDGEHRLSSVLRRRVAIGGVLSVIVALGLLVGGIGARLLSHVRRARLGEARSRS